MIRNIVIIGAGAMGCLFAARLGRAGFDVTLVDIDRVRLSLIGREGLVLCDDAGEQRVPTRAMLAAEVNGPMDLVVIFTKSIHTRAAAASVRHLAAFSPAVLSLQNGVGNAELIGESFDPGRIVIGTAHVPADIELPNKVISRGFGHLALGRFRGGADQPAAAVGEALQRAGFDTKVSENVEGVIWEKLAFNAALNALGMVTGSSNGELDNEFARQIALRLVVEETVLVSLARGTELDGSRIFAMVERALTEHSGHKASMLQDREAGRPTEIDFINGAVIREGERLGIGTPTHAVLTNLVKLTELKDGRSVEEGRKAFR